MNDTITGINWYASFDHPTNGFLPFDPASGIRGGHEVVLDALNAEDASVHLTNSWGAQWGTEGGSWMAWSTLEELLHEQGDVTTATP